MKKNILFYFFLIVTLAYFVWSRLDFSDHIYYFGDGTAAVELIHLMLETGNWDTNWYRLTDVLHLEDELAKLQAILPGSPGYSYHGAGYMIVAASICKTLYTFGLSSLSIQKILHGINFIVQALTLVLLFLTGKQIANRSVGLLAVVFFTLFPLAVMEAHYERIESWLCLLALALVYVSLYFPKAPKTSSLGMGLLIGLSIATKVSQMYLGLIPLAVLINQFFSARHNSIANQILSAGLCGVLIIFGIFLAMLINTPFIFNHIPDQLASLQDVQTFYMVAAYPYAEEYYSYTNQLYVIGRYFALTLGLGWILCFFAGIVAKPQENVTRFVLVAPVIFLIFYFATQVNFIERNFSYVEGLISLTSAIGFYFIWQKITEKTTAKFIKYVVGAGMIAAVFYVPLKLDTVFVKNHIKKTPHSGQTEFQNRMKADFPGFWIKNLDFNHNITQMLPEKLAKAPRIYQIEDLNEHHARQYVEKLKANGFVHVAQYCSDFFSMPPNTLTIYHAAAKNNYFVRKEEWPAGLRPDYFNTNCP